jgi:hypothetical protein
LVESLKFDKARRRLGLSSVFEELEITEGKCFN